MLCYPQAPQSAYVPFRLVKRVFQILFSIASGTAYKTRQFSYSLKKLLHLAPIHIESTDSSACNHGVCYSCMTGSEGIRSFPMLISLSELMQSAIRCWGPICKQDMICLSIVP